MISLLALIAVCALGFRHEEGLAGILDVLESEVGRGDMPTGDWLGVPVVNDHFRRKKPSDKWKHSPCEGYTPQRLVSQMDRVQFTTESKKFGRKTAVRLIGWRWECKDGYYNFALKNVDDSNNQREINDYYVCMGPNHSGNYLWIQKSIDQGDGNPLRINLPPNDSTKLDCRPRVQKINGIIFNTCRHHVQCAVGEFCVMTMTGNVCSGDPKKILRCGGEGQFAHTCSACSQGHGAKWCNGDCAWS